MSEAWVTFGATLGGVVVGALMTGGFAIWTENARAKRDDAVRFASDRRSTYARFIAAIDALDASASYPNHLDAEMLVRTLFREICLIAGTEVRAAAEELFKQSDMRFLLRDGGSPEQRLRNQQQLVEAHHRFFVAARGELRIEELPT